MFFNLQAWTERFEKARAEKNPGLVRDLLDEIADEYFKVVDDNGATANLATQSTA